MIKIGNKTIKGVYIKIGNDVKRLLVQMKDGNQVRNFIRYTIQKILTYDFTESTSSSRSNTFTIDNLISVDEITVDNGKVSYTINNNKVTVNVSGGSSRSVWDSTRYSKYVTDYTTSSIDSFSSTKSYSSGGYSGTLRKSGNSYVSSGSYTPADSKVVKVIKTVSGGLKYTWDGSKWTSQRVNINGSNTISYNENGYSGTLKADLLNPISETGIWAKGAQGEWLAAHPNWKLCWRVTYIIWNRNL